MDDKNRLQLDSSMEKLDIETTAEATDFEMLEDEDYVGTSDPKIPARVREIITKSLGSNSWDSSRSEHESRRQNFNEGRLNEENKLLKSELDRMERMLSTVMGERDDIAIKYSDMSGKFESTLKSIHGRSTFGGDNDDSSDETETSGGSMSLLKQNAELQKILNEERMDYRRKLQIYHDSQQKNAVLVEKLQSKVVQYKKKCNELEEKAREFNLQTVDQKPFLELQKNHVEQSKEFEQLLRRVDEEVHRANNLVLINESLEQQLLESNNSNKPLNSEVQRLTNLVRQLEIRQQEWDKEKQLHEERNHRKLMTLWKTVNSLRKTFHSMKTSTDRDVTNTVNEMSQVSRLLQNACYGLSRSSQSSIDKQKEQLESMEFTRKLEMKNEELIELREELKSLRLRKDESLRELNLEVERLNAVISDKDYSLALLEVKLSTLENQERFASGEISSEAGRKGRTNMRSAFSKSIDNLNSCGSEESQDEKSNGDLINSLDRRSHHSNTNNRNSNNSNTNNRNTNNRNNNNRNTNNRNSNNNRSHSASPVRPGNHGDGMSKKMKSNSSLGIFQSMMHRKQMEILELKNKILKLSNENYNLSRRMEDLEEERREMRKSLEIVEGERVKLLAKHEMLVSCHDDTMSEINNYRFGVERLEDMKRSLLKQINEANSDNRNLLASIGGLQRDKDSLNDENIKLIKEKERLMKEKDKHITLLEDSDEKFSRIKEEIVSLKDHLHKSSLRMEVIEKEKAGLEHEVSKSTQLRCDLELDLGKVRQECICLKDSITRIQILNEDVSNDNIHLKEYVKKMESERCRLVAEKTELEHERSFVREILDQLENSKLDLENERSNLLHKNEILKESKEKLENELIAKSEEEKKNLERTEVVVRQNIEVTKEFSAIKLEFERYKEIATKLGKDKDEFVNERMSLMIQLANIEKDYKHTKEETMNLKAERDNMGMQCEDFKSEILNLEEKIMKLEEMNHAVTMKLENLNDDISRLTQELDSEKDKNDRLKKLMEEKIAEKEASNSEVVRKFKSDVDESFAKALQEKNQMREHFESDYTELQRRFAKEKSEMVTKMEREKESLEKEMNAIKQLNQQQLLEAEQEKQELITATEADRSKHLEKISLHRRQFTDAQNSFLRTRRELETKCKQTEITVAELEGELKVVKADLVKNRSSYDKELKRLTDHVEMLNHDKENMKRDLADHKAQIRVALETKDSFKNELNNAHNNIMKVESDRENARKEYMNLMRTLKEESYEKEVSIKMADDLKNLIRKLEAEKLDLNRIILDVKQQLTGMSEQKTSAQKELRDLRDTLKDVEKNRLEVKKELQDSRRHLKVLEMEKIKLTHEVAENLSLLERSNGRVEEMKKDVLVLKQKIVESENSKEALRNDNVQLSRRLSESEKESRSRSEELRRTKEDLNKTETQNEEEKNRLASTLETVHQKCLDLETKCMEAEDKMKRLEDKTSSVEADKIDLEEKLGSLVTSIVRNFGSDDPKFRIRSNISYRNASRSSSAGGSRRRNRSQSPLKFSIPNVEDVKLVLKECAQDHSNMERERNEAFSKLEMSQAKLTDMLVNQERLVSKLEIVTISLEDLEKVKNDMEKRNGLLQSKLMSYEEEFVKGNKDNRQLAERVASLELTIRSLDKERLQHQDQISQMKDSETKLEEERKHLKQVVDDGEKKLRMRESERRVLEGEMYWMKVALNDKETEHQVVCSRMDQLLRQIEDLELKAQSYQTTVDRLNSALNRCSEENTNHKDKMNVLNMSISDKSNAVNTLHERLNQLHGILASSEQDKKILQESLQTSRQSLGEARRQLANLEEKLENTKMELLNSESRRVEVEAQTKSLNNVYEKHLEEERHLNYQINKLHQEKLSLQEMVMKLKKSLDNIKTEARHVEVNALKLKRDKTSLRKSLNKSEEFLNKTTMEKSQMDRTLKELEDENYELTDRMKSLQDQLDDAEHKYRQKLLELSSRHREERDLDIERLLSDKLQTEKLLEARERSHRQTVKSLEEQVYSLKDRLNRELRFDKHDHQPDAGTNHSSGDNTTNHFRFDKSITDRGRTSAYFNETSNRRGTSPAKVISARVTRHNSPPKPSFSPKKSARLSVRK